MKNNTSKTNLLYELGYTLTTALGLSSLLSPLLVDDSIRVLRILLPILIAGILVFFKKAGQTGRLIFLGIVVALVITGFLLSRNDAVAVFFLTHPSYLWLPAIGASAFLLGELMCLFRLARVAVSAAGVGWMIFGTIGSYTISKLFVCASLLILLLTILEGTQLRWSKQGQTEHKAHVVYVAPFLLLTILIVLITPAPDEPYDWGFAKRIVAAAESAWEGFLDLLSIDSLSDDMSDPAEAVIGFSEKGGIGGNIRGGEREVMVVSGHSYQVSGLKLAGKTFADFNGKEWTDNDDSEAHDVLLDTIAMWASLEAYTDRESDFARRASINIEYRGLPSTHAFLPLKTMRTYHDMASNDYHDLGGDILWKEPFSAGSIYTAFYYSLNTDHEVFDDYLNEACAPSENRYREAEQQLNTYRLTGCTYADYLSHKQHILDTYSSAPTLSPRLRAYMDEVYKGAKTKVEKLKRLEAMLRSFTYTRSPGPLPEKIQTESDFLDYFILESKQGFCSHYATAFVLLARAEGIPARYVQGYLVNTDGKRAVSVKSADAHAWPEVYFDGAGWIAYEPTPTMQKTLTYWKTEEERKVEGSDPVEHWEPSHESPSDTTAELPESGTDGFRFRWYMITIPIAIGILFILLSFTIRKILLRIRFHKKTPEEQFLTLCRQTLRILRLTGYEMKENETLTEYRERLIQADITDISFLKTLEKYLYKNELDTDAIPAILIEKEQLLFRLKKTSKRKYIRYLSSINA